MSGGVVHEKPIPLAAVQPTMRNITVVCIVLDAGSVRRTQQGFDVHTLRVADPTGSMTVSILPSMPNGSEYIHFIQPGDILRLRQCSANVYKGTMSLSCGRSTEIHKTGEYVMAYSELPNFSEYSPELAQKFAKKNEDLDSPGGGGGGGGGPPSQPPRAPGEQQRPGGQKRANQPPPSSSSGSFPTSTGSTTSHHQSGRMQQQPSVADRVY